MQIMRVKRSSLTRRANNRCHKIGIRNCLPKAFFDLGAPFHPLTLCEYRVDCEGIFDTRDRKAMKRERVSKAELECPSWNQEMLDGKVPASQQLADRLIARGYVGMLVRSFAQGVSPEDMNLVLWKWTKRRPHKVTLFDPDERLPRDGSSWGK